MKQLWFVTQKYLNNTYLIRLLCNSLLIRICYNNEDIEIMSVTTNVNKIQYDNNPISLINVFSISII